MMVFKGSYYYIIDEFANIHWMDWEYGEIFGIYKVKPETIGQYIGSKDIHDKEIYEGDVARAKINLFYANPEIVGKIEFRNGCFVIVGISGLYKDRIFRIDQLKEIEVIGNIYENEELLKEVRK